MCPCAHKSVFVCAYACVIHTLSHQTRQRQFYYYLPCMSVSKIAVHGELSNIQLPHMTICAKLIKEQVILQLSGAYQPENVVRDI